jgi:drug/metabolite transporter (DMT)-like permease
VTLSSDTRGSLFMVVSMAGFAVNDSLTKLASAEMNVGQVMLIRGVFATIMIGLLAWQQGALRLPKLALHPMVITRVASEILATVSFLIGLAHLPLANSSAILQTLPLSVTLGAAIFLGEPIGWRRLVAIAVGFLGVVIIVRPGFEGFNSFALFSLFSVLCCTARDLATSRAPKHIPSTLISFVTSAFVTVAGGLTVMPMGGWQEPRIETVGILALAACMVLIGYQFVIMAMRAGNVSAVAPFRYTNLLWAIILGFLIFGDLPDLPMIVGSVIIVLSGIYTLLRERRVSRAKPATASTGPAMAPDGV